MAYFEELFGFLLRTDNGERIATYDKINRQDNGVTFVCNNSWGVVDKEGKETISPSLKHIDDYENGYATFDTYDGHQGAIDKDGKIAIQPIFKTFWGFNKNGIAIVTYDDSTCNLINTSGETLFSTNYPDIIGLDNGFFNFFNDELYALASPDGKIITPFRYKEIYKCTHDLFSGALDKGGVVINAEGKEITVEHNFIRIMPNGFIFTFDNDKTLTIFDNTGSTIFVRENVIAKDYFKSLNDLTKFFEKYPNATVTDCKLTVPWEIFGI